nr:glycosyltransferase family 4 protein [Haloglomus halophilum]
MIDPRIGGPQLRSLAVAKRLREHDVETEFLLPDGDDEFVKRAREDEFKVHRPGFSRIHPPKDIINNSKYLLKFPLAVHRIQRVIQDREIDVVHANMSLNFDASIATWRSDAALVWHFNDVLVPWPLTRIAGLLSGAIADERVVASGSVADHYFATTNGVQKLYAPVDIQEFNPDNVTGSGLREELGVPEDTIIVGGVGNLNPIKGHEYIIRAAAQVQSKTEHEIVVPIAGGVLDSRMEYFEHLKSLRSELGLEQTVHFLGRRSDIPQLLSQFDIFVLPSIAEACPMAVLEAMAMRKPVVATSVGGVPEQITDGESGWLVPPKDSQELANAIVKAVEDEGERHRREKNARQKAVDVFSLERCIERHLETYSKAME